MCRRYVNDIDVLAIEMERLFFGCL
jgi:hypothetical protein